MAQATAQTDKGIGLAVAFSVIAVVGALLMFLGAADQLLAATGFGVAVLAGSLAVAALHAFSS
jgi:hypothetical protein